MQWNACTVVARCWSACNSSSLEVNKTQYSQAMNDNQFILADTSQNKPPLLARYISTSEYHQQ